jgi:MFS family permease
MSSTVSATVTGKYRRALIIGQVMAGLGIGATITMGSILATHIGGSESYAGLAAAMSTLGAALAAIPLARAATRYGRRFALVTGAMLAAAGAVTIIFAGGLMSIPIVVIGLMGVGVGGAVNLQARFAITDVANPERRGRDLSLVVWATTLGAVLGPNLNAVGVEVGHFLGLPDYTGPFLFTAIAQLAAGTIYFLLLPSGIKPGEVIKKTGRVGAVISAKVSGLTIAVIALSHATMVSVMSMTPVHLVHEGQSIAYAGFVVSIHVAGMYAFSPIFGFLADRLGRLQTMFIGQGILLASLLVTGLYASNPLAVMLGLFLLGFGWSASTVSGSTLMSESAPLEKRTVFQGRSDTIQSATGALAAVASGPVMAIASYAGLALATLMVVASAIVLLFITRLVGLREA